MVPESLFQRLLAGVRQGCHVAWGQLIRLTEEADSSRYVGCRDTVRHRWSDVVQTAWVKIMNSIQQFKGSTFTDWLNWVWRIRENTQLNFFRDQKRAKRSVEREQPIHDGIAGRDASPSSDAVGRERQAEIERAFCQLSRRDQEVIRLRLFSGLSFEEVGRRLEINSEAARRAFTRAMCRWEKSMGGAA